MSGGVHLLRRLSTQCVSVAHPFLFTAYFVVFLFAENVEEQVSFNVVLPPLLVVLAGTALTLLLLASVFRRAVTAGLATTAAVVMFLSYGHVWRAAEGKVDERAFLFLWVIAFVIAIVVISRLRSAAVRASEALCVMGAFLVAISVVPIANYRAAAVASEVTPLPSDLAAGPGADAVQRDIYFLVFDRYPAEETLREEFGYDNRAFLDALEERGFYVAPQSAANYGKTSLSLASTLNMQYLDMAALRQQAGSGRDWKPVFEMLQGPLAAPAFLEAAGYRHIQVGTWYQATRVNALADQTLVYGGAPEFASVLYETSILRSLALFGVEAELAWRDLVRLHTLYQLDRLEEMRDAPGPKFVFAHVTLPHDPYVFDATGAYLSEEDARARPNSQNFTEHVEYANARILRIVDRLLDVPEEERPIILLTSDEGPYPARYAGNQESFLWTQATEAEVLMKYRILNTYYLPGRDHAVLYPSISPVNTFRVVLNAYFDTDLPLLPDRSFAYLNETRIYDQIDVSQHLQTHRTAVTIPSASYDLDPPIEWLAGATAHYQVRIENRGDDTWSPRGEDGVELALSFESTSDAPGWGREQRFPLPGTVRPGDAVTVRVAATAPATPGPYRLRHRILRGSGEAAESATHPITVSDVVTDWRSALRASYQVVAPTGWTVGESQTYRVRVRNHGTTTWGTDIRLGIHFGQESDVPHDGWLTDQRVSLPSAVAPGASATVEVVVTAPDVTGTFTLRHRLVMEGVTWFEPVEPLTVTVTAAGSRSVPESTYALV